MEKLKTNEPHANESARDYYYLQWLLLRGKSQIIKFVRKIVRLMSHRRESSRSRSFAVIQNGNGNGIAFPQCRI